MRNLKNLFCLAALMFFSVYSQGQSNYYYYQGKKIFLEESTDDVFIRLSSDANQTELSSFLNSSSYKKMKSEGKVSSYKILHLSTNNKSAFEKNKELERLRENRNILSANFMLKFEGGSLQGCSNEFVVKLSPSTSFSDFESLCKKNKILSLEENRFVRGKYILTTSKKSNKGILQLANEFYETGFFEYSEPVFFREKILHTNDPLYGNQ